METIISKIKAFFRQRTTPSKTQKCFICNKEGHWANACPQKYRNPKLATLFQDTLEPSMWDLFYCNLDEEPSGEIYYPKEEDQEVFAPRDSSDDDISI